MRAYGDYVYYLPKVKESQLTRLSEAEKGLCDKLFRMRPGSDVKELIAEQVDGYMVLNDTIYYAQAGSIHSAVSGVEIATGEGKYTVEIKDDSCYLVDELGNPAVSDNGDSVAVGDRIYRIEEDGKIKYVKHGQLTIDGSTYYLSGSGTKATVNSKKDSNDTVLIRETYGVQSYCIVDNQIYYSSYVDKGFGGEWYSRIFKTDLNGQNKQALSEPFPGVIQNMYYYEEEGEIFGEYHPSIWNGSYGVAAVISRDGAIYKINDESARTGKHVDGNDMLEIVMAKDGKVICLWHDCEWNKGSGITKVLWSKAVELNGSDRSLIDMASVDASNEEEGSQDGNEVIVPIETLPGEVPAPTMAPGSPAGNPSSPVMNPGGPVSDPATPGGTVTGTDKPGQEVTVPVPTIPPAAEPTSEIRIVPIG